LILCKITAVILQIVRLSLTPGIAEWSEFRIVPCIVVETAARPFQWAEESSNPAFVGVAGVVLIGDASNTTYAAWQKPPNIYRDGTSDAVFATKGDALEFLNATVSPAALNCGVPPQKRPKIRFGTFSPNQRNEKDETENKAIPLALNFNKAENDARLDRDQRIWLSFWCVLGIIIGTVVLACGFCLCSLFVPRCTREEEDLESRIKTSRRESETNRFQNKSGGKQTILSSLKNSDTVKQTNLGRVRTIYDFVPNGSKPGEMPLSKGDIVSLIEDVDDNGWALGACNERVGWFPMSFCERIVDRDLAVAAEQAMVVKKDTKKKKKTKTKKTKQEAQKPPRRHGVAVASGICNGDRGPNPKIK
jgi:hypothetical protein